MAPAPPRIFGSVIKFVGEIVEEVPSPTEAEAIAAHEALMAVARGRTTWD